MAEIQDIKIDLKTGFTEIDPATGDAVIITGIDVIAQDTALRLRTQLGEVQRQDLDNYGWDYLSRLKADMALPELITTSKLIAATVLQDERITDAEAIPATGEKDTVTFNVTIEAAEGSTTFVLSV